MSEQDNVRLIEKWYEAVNAHDVSPLEEHRGPGYEWETSVAPGPAGIEEDNASMQANWLAFPDARIKVLRTIAQGDVVAVTGLVTGTNEGPMTMPDGQTIPATGKSLSVPFSEWFEIADGKVVHRFMYWDMLSAMAQMGLGTGA